jgi:prepilin-type N-terminal cleavage/methylation domain-containing protein
VSRNQRGFTLIELMISIGLFGLIAAGAMSLVMSSARSQARSARIDVVQAGARAGMDFITRDLLSVSAGASSGKLTIGATGATQLPLIVTDNTTVSGVTGPDKLELWLVDANYQAVVTTQILPATLVFTIDQNPGFSNGAWLQICDFTNGILVKPSFSGVTVTLPGTSTLPAGVTSFAAGSYALKVRHVTYAIEPAQFGVANSASANGSVLTFDDGSGPQPLADGVEDLQVALGFDNNGDGLISDDQGAATGGDEWLFNNSGETNASMPATLAGLKSVRITLVVKASQPEPGLQVARPAAENHAAGAAYDSFMRRTIRTEISVRNFNL